MNVIRSLLSLVTFITVPKVINLYQPRAVNDNLFLAERTRVELNFEGRGFETLPRQTEIFACSAVWTNSFKNISCYDYRVDNITCNIIYHIIIYLFNFLNDSEYFFVRSPLDKYFFHLSTKLT
jgi:hypothetical protein